MEICRDYNPVRKSVELMLKEFSKDHLDFDLRIDHFVKVSEHLGTKRPEFNNRLTEFVLKSPSESMIKMDDIGQFDILSDVK